MKKNNLKKCLTALVLISSVTGYSQIIITFAGNGYNEGTGNGGYSGDGGQATAAEFWAPEGVTFDASGNLYIADNANQCIRKVNTSDSISTIAGMGPAFSGFSGDGGPATAAELSDPSGVAFDALGNLYIADLNNSHIRMVNTSGIINTIAGCNFGGYSGDGGPATAAELGEASGIALDALGNLYIADASNQCIRKVNTSGIINTIAGLGPLGYGYSGDGGPATAAELDVPSNIALDASGNLYIVDNQNSCIRKVNTSGTISTFAGLGPGYSGFSGDGGQATAAEFNQPTDIALDALGNVYIIDAGNNRMRFVNTSGIISTLAGNNDQGYWGDGGPATAAEFDNVYGLTLDASGKIYIGDAGNNRVRIITSVTGINQLSLAYNEVSVYPNPSKGEMNVVLGGNGYSLIKLYDLFGKEAYSRLLNEIQSDLQLEVNVANLPDGVYFIQIMSKNGNISKKIIIAN